MAKLEIAVVGAGLMGHGIAQVFAVAGHRVNLYDPLPQVLSDVRSRIADNLTALGQNHDAVSRIEPQPDLLLAVRNAAMVIEAAPEKLAVKQELMQSIVSAAPLDCIFASNTSVIPIAQIGAKLEDSSRLVGTHWWNPPYLIPLVEIVPSSKTDLNTIERCRQILLEVGKTPVVLKKDIPGFVGNRLQHAMWREAIALIEAGVCDAETVDTVVKNSFGIRLAVLGPLENVDLVGLDLTEDIHRVLLPALDRSVGPNPLLSGMVKDKKLGMKTGQGFYSWTQQSSDRVRKNLVAYLRRYDQQRRENKNN